MFLVAITEINGPLETTTLNTLAQEIGTIARHKYVPVVLDRTRVIPSQRMAIFRNFDLAKTRFTIDSSTNESRLYEDISVLIRATHRNVRESVEHINERTFRPVMARVTGGIVMSKKRQRT
jgi:hypothetical protein